MASDNKIHLPGGMGGLMRYDDEYQSRFMITPTHVIMYIVLVVLFVIGLKIFLG